jgi:hypothetical protein
MVDQEVIETSVDGHYIPNMTVNILKNKGQLTFLTHIFGFK